jgi:hypothetical protein
MTSKSINSKPLHFITSSYPRFGRGVYSEQNPPQSVKDSPFFWWFKFLQLNQDYLATEKKNGNGACSALYKDFGNVSDKDFKTWWREHAHLFAEAPTEFRLQIAKAPSELAPFDSKDALNIVVPLNWSRKSLKKHFAVLIDKYVVEGEVGPKIGSDSAKYSLGARWNCGAMESAYNIYKLRMENSERGAAKTPKAQHKGKVSAKFKVSWADIAIMANLKVAEGLKVGAKLTSETSEVRRKLTILADRHYKNASKYITSAATASFPKT